MAYSTNACVFMLTLFACFFGTYGHSWLDCVQVTNPMTVTNLNNMQCAAYPRGYVGRSNPDANMWKIEGMTQQQWTTYPACRNADRKYSAQYPMLKLKAGEKMTIAYTPNGHTMWHNPPPPNGPRDFYVKWTGRAGVDLKTMSEVNAAASLLTVQFDTPCHSRVNGAQLDSSAGICQADVTIPAGTPAGTYQFVWWWPFDFAGGNVIEEYTTCWDVEVTASGTPVTTGVVTTGVVTTGRVTTGVVTTGRVTTGVVTTGPVTTGSITTGVATTGSQNNGVKFYPSNDAFVRGGPYSAINYGSETQLTIKGAAGGNDEFSREAYLKYDLSSLSGYNIVSAQLKVFSAGGAPLNFDVGACSGASSWTDSSLIWNNKPQSTQAGHIDTSGVASLDASVLQSAISNGYLTLRLYDGATTDATMIISSRKSGTTTAPVLTIQSEVASGGGVITTGNTLDATSTGTALDQDLNLNATKGSAGQLAVSVFLLVSSLFVVIML